MPGGGVKLLTRMDRTSAPGPAIVVPDAATLGGAASPEVVGGQAEQEQDDGDRHIAKLDGVAEREVDGVGHDRASGQHEDHRRERVPSHAVGSWLTSRRSAYRENGGGAQAIENPADKNDAADKLGKFAGARQNGRPHAERNDRSRGSAKPRMNFRQFFEEQIVDGHRVEHARRGEDHGVRRAKGGDQNRKRDDFTGPWTQHRGGGGCGDGIALVRGHWTERNQVSDVGHQIETHKNERAEKKRAGKRFLRIEHFSGAVGAELPALISPKHRDHRQAETGKQRGTRLRRTHSSGQFSCVSTQRKKKAAEQHDQQNFDERGPILQIRALAGAPDVDRGNDGNHQHRNDSRTAGGERNDFGQISRERARQRRHGTAGDHQEQRPPVQKRGDAPETVADEAVESTRFRIAGSEFGIGQRPEQRKNSTHNPHQKGKAHRAVELLQDEARRQKNPGANDRADEQQKEIALTQRADEWGHGSRCIVAGVRRWSMPSSPKPQFSRQEHTLRTVRVLFDERSRHKAEDENEQGERSRKPAASIQRHRIVNGNKAEKANHQQQRAPHVPAGPKMEQGQAHQDER